jgi:ADP-ribose pyrophosphatase YjhB (NUDIX family)
MNPENDSLPERFLPSREIDLLESVDEEADRVRRELDWSLAAFGAFFSESLQEVFLVRLGKYAKSITWSLPGGGVRADERPSRAVGRELTEEAGIAFEQGTLRLAAWLARPTYCPWNRPDRPGELVLLFAGLANPLDPKLRPSPPETVAVDFVPFTLKGLLAAAKLSEEEHPLGGIRKHWCYWARLGQSVLENQLNSPVVWTYETREAIAEAPWKPVVTPVDREAPRQLRSDSAS